MLKYYYSVSVSVSSLLWMSSFNADGVVNLFCDCVILFNFFILRLSLQNLVNFAASSALLKLQVFTIPSLEPKATHLYL